MPFPEFEVQSKSKRRLRLLHISDLHFKEETNFVNDMAVFESAARNLAPYDLILVTGDLVDFSVRNNDRHRDVLINTRSYLVGFAEEYCINKTKGMVVIPGNHDYRWKGLERNVEAEGIFQSVYQEFFSHRFFFFEHFPPLFVGCFDSNRSLPDTSTIDFARGAISIPDMLRDAAEMERQIQSWSKAAATETQKKAAAWGETRRVALVHHHPLPVSEAERLDLRGRWEKILGTQIIGAAEYMLLRNAGVFLQTLLNSGFRLALHGHLHEPGFWRAHGTTAKEQARWIEVLSASSVLDGVKRGFNTIDLSRDGVASVTAHEFSGQGVIRPGRKLPSANYDVVRGIMDDRLETQPKLQFELYSECYTVHLDTGDLDCVDIRRGIQSLSDDSEDIFTIKVQAAALTMTEFEAWSIDNENSVSLPPTPSAEEGWVDYRIRLDPPAKLEEPNPGFLAHIRYRSVMYSSQEDKKMCKELEEPQHDQILEVVRQPIDRMIIKTRFISSHPHRYPRDVSLEVIRPDGTRADDEAQSGYVSFGYLNPKQASKANTDPEATLTIFKPRLGFQYKLKWTLESDPLVNSIEVSRRRLAILALKDEPGKCQQFLLAALEILKGHCPNGSGSDVAAYLFAFNSESYELIAIAAFNSPRQDTFAAKAFGYGHDVVGSSFRLRKALFYVRRDTHFKYFRRLEPDDLEFLIACPILSPDGSALACVAFGSRQQQSQLLKCGGSPLATISQEINALFQKSGL